MALAIEIVSPETRSLDWTTKPMAYTFAKIPLCWVVEATGELSVDVFELDPDDGVYWPTAAFTGEDTIRLDRPWPIEIPLSTIRPRNL